MAYSQARPKFQCRSVNEAHKRAVREVQTMHLNKKGVLIQENNYKILLKFYTANKRIM